MADTPINHDMIIQPADLSPVMAAHLQKSDHRLQEYIRLAELGLTVSEFVANDRQVDIVKAEIDRLLAKVNIQIYDVASIFTNQVDQAMASQFDQSNSQSYVSRWHDAMRSNLEAFVKDIKSMSDLANQTVKAMVENAGKVSMDKVQIVQDLFVQADKNFNPNVSDGYFGMFRTILTNLEQRMSQQLDKDYSAGFAGRLNSDLSVYFGPMSPVLTSMQTMLDKYMATIQADMISLRESIARKEGELDMLQKASAKGAVFEDVLKDVLSGIAAATGDVVTFTGTEKIQGSKKGDFLYEVGKTKIVIEAKDTGVNVKAMLRYMEEAMTVRNAEFGILCTRNADQLEKQVDGLNVYGNVLFCQADMLPLALRWAKLYLTKLRGEAAKGADAQEIKAAIATIMTTMKGAATVKQKLTAIRGNISTETQAIADIVDEMKNAVSRDLAKIEAEIGKG